MLKCELELGFVVKGLDLDVAAFAARRIEPVVTNDVPIDAVVARVHQRHATMLAYAHKARFFEPPNREVQRRVCTVCFGTGWLPSQRRASCALIQEYLIRPSQHTNAGVPRRDGDCLHGPGFGCLVIEGPGDIRTSYGNAEVEFSGEDLGWHVTVHAPVDDLDARVLLAALTARVAEASGEDCELLRLT